MLVSCHTLGKRLHTWETEPILDSGSNAYSEEEEEEEEESGGAMEETPPCPAGTSPQQQQPLLNWGCILELVTDNDHRWNNFKLNSIMIH